MHHTITNRQPSRPSFPKSVIGYTELVRMLSTINWHVVHIENVVQFSGTNNCLYNIMSLY